MDLFRVPDFLKKFYERGISEHQVKEWLEKYKHDREEVGALTSDKAADELKKNTTPYASYFSQIKLPNNAPLALDAAAIKLIDKTLTDVSLADSAIDDFQARIKAANAISKNDSEHEFSAENYCEVLETLKLDLERSIKAQHDKERQELEALFSTPGFITNTQELKSNVERTHIKDEMLKALDNAQKEQIKKFDDSLKPEIDKLKEKKMQEDALLSFLAYIADKKANTDFLRKLMQNNNAALDNSAGYAISGNTISLLGIKAEDIKQFTSISGKTIQLTGDPGFSINTNRFGFAVTKADQLAVALGIRAVLVARGVTEPTITTSISHTNEESALKLAKDAFESALEAGFLEKDITVNVNGKPKNANEVGANTSITALTKDYHDVRGNAKLKEKILAIKATPMTIAPVGSTQPTPTSYKK